MRLGMVPIGRHKFRSALQTFPRPMVPERWRLGESHRGGVAVPIAMVDFSRRMVSVLNDRINVSMDRENVPMERRLFTRGQRVE